jgi:hypothetical protein
VRRRDRLKVRTYAFLSSPRFPTIRLCVYLVQVPPAVVFTWLASSVQYLVFLSLAALIESALTDVVATWEPPAPKSGPRVAGFRRRR